MNLILARRDVHANIFYSFITYVYIFYMQICGMYRQENNFGFHNYIALKKQTEFTFLPTR